jgi:hypothetical protein
MVRQYLLARLTNPEFSLKLMKGGTTAESAVNTTEQTTNEEKEKEKWEE